MMKRTFMLISLLFFLVIVASCGTLISDDGGVREAMSDKEIQRYRQVFYLKMLPGQRDHYEGLENRATRDRYLRFIGLLKDKKRKKR